MLTDLHRGIQRWMQGLADCRRRLDAGELDGLEATLLGLGRRLSSLRKRMASGFAANWYMENTHNRFDRRKISSPFFTRTVQSAWKLSGSHEWLRQELTRLERDFQVVSGARSVSGNDVDTALKIWEKVLKTEPDHRTIRRHLDALIHGGATADGGLHGRVRAFGRRYDIRPMGSVSFDGLREIGIARCAEPLILYDRAQRRFFSVDRNFSVGQIAGGGAPIVQPLEDVPATELERHQIHFAAFLNDHDRLLYSHRDRALHLWQGERGRWRTLHTGLIFVRHRVADGRFYFNDFETGRVWRSEISSPEEKTCIYQSAGNVMDFDLDPRGDLFVIEGRVRNGQWIGSLVRCAPERRCLLRDEKRLVSLSASNNAVWGLSRQPVTLHKIDPESGEEIIRWPHPLLADVNQIVREADMLHLYFNGGNHLHRFAVDGPAETAPSTHSCAERE